MLEDSTSAQQLVAKALRAASTGELATARSEIKRALDQYDAALRVDKHLFADALQAALTALDLDAASDLIGRKFGTGKLFCIDFEETGHRSILRWELGGQRQSRLWLQRQITHTDTVKSLVVRLTAILSLLTGYCLSDDCELGQLSVNLGDIGYTPGLAFSEYRPDYFLIPDAIFLWERGYERMRQIVAEKNTSWNQRRSIGFWRGGTSGFPTDPALGWRSLPRVKLCVIGQEHPDLIDAGISYAGQNASEAEVRAAGLMRPFVPLDQLPGYKYQIDIDGNSNSWPGLFQKLLTGSPVLKVASSAGYQQWYYDRLLPWHNFVPVVSDMSDLVEKILWLRSHDDEARRIGEAGKKLADSLDYRSELVRGRRTVTAALRYFAGNRK